MHRIPTTMTKVVQSTTRTRYLRSKVLVSDSAALILTANLTDTDLFRNTNHLSIERNREQVEAAAASLLLLEEETPDGPIAAEFASSDTLVPLEIRRLLGVDRLNPMQAGAIPKVLHQRDNLVIAAPTGAGKTLVAEVALLQEALDRGKTGVYLAPMRAIAAEKRDDWQRLEAAGVRVYKTTGEGAVLIFCGSRKGVEGCASHLGQALATAAPESRRRVHNADLARTLAAGVGFHHAGLIATTARPSSSCSGRVRSRCWSRRRRWPRE